MRRLVAAALLAALVLPGCLGGIFRTDSGWREWSAGAFRFHVPERDVAEFPGLEAEALGAAANLSRALNQTLRGPVDVWAYLPQPPPAPDGTRLRGFPAQMEANPGDGARIWLPTLPIAWMPLSPPRPTNHTGSLTHELVHVFQFERAHDAGTRHVPDWILEGGATWEARGEGEMPPEEVVGAARILLDHAPVPSFARVFDDVSPENRSKAVHFGGELALRYLATRCNLSSPPWIDLVEAIGPATTLVASQVRAVPVSHTPGPVVDPTPSPPSGGLGRALFERCGASEPDLVAGWRVALQAASDRAAASILPPPPADAIVTAPGSDSLLDACQRGGMTWVVRTDGRSSWLMARGGDRSSYDLSPLGFFAVSLACRSDGSVLALGLANGAGAVAWVGDTSRVVGTVPFPVSALSWNAARDEGFYWTGDPAEPTLVRLAANGAATVVGPGPGSARMAFDPDGGTAWYATRLPNGTLEDWRASAEAPLANATLAALHLRILQADGDAVWALRFNATDADSRLVAMAAPDGPGFARFPGQQAFPGEGEVLIPCYPADSSFVELRPIPLPGT